MSGHPQGQAVQVDPPIPPPFRPMQELDVIFRQVANDGVTVPPGIHFGWQIPGDGNADRELKTTGVDYFEEGERRYHQYDRELHIERHYRKKAEAEAAPARDAAIAQAIRDRLIQKGQDPSKINAAKIALVMAQIDPPPGSDEKTLTRSELEATFIVGRAAAQTILNQRASEYAPKKAARQQALEAKLSAKRAKIPLPEQAGGKRHIMFEVTTMEPIWQFQDEDGETIPVRDILDQAPTNTHRKWFVHRHLEYDAVNTLEEVQAVVAEMVAELLVQKSNTDYAIHVMDEVKKK